MLVPAFLMGLAFPLAGAVWSVRTRDRSGTRVGRLLTANTDRCHRWDALVSGFFFIRWFGIERSLQMLVADQRGHGTSRSSRRSTARRWPVALAAAATTGLILARVALPDWGRAWDETYFATYVNSWAVHGHSGDGSEAACRRRGPLLPRGRERDGQRHAIPRRGPGLHRQRTARGFDGPDRRPAAEGARSRADVAPPRPEARLRARNGNGNDAGRDVDSPRGGAHRPCRDRGKRPGRCQAPSPRWNSNVLENPKLEIVFNDGRNFLATTREKFDVITADPIHPWSGGAGYLYTAEYFRSIAEHLAPGGVAAQWLPLYELSVNDVKTVVRTFSSSFPHSMVWLTYYDAVLVGSNQPIRLDEDALARRIERPRHPAGSRRRGHVHTGRPAVVLSAWARRVPAPSGATPCSTPTTT